MKQLNLTIKTMFAAALCGIVLTSCGGNSAGSNETGAGETATQSVEVFIDNSPESLAKQNIELWMKASEAEDKGNDALMEECLAKQKEIDKKAKQLSIEDQKIYKKELERLTDEVEGKR